MPPRVRAKLDPPRVPTVVARFRADPTRIRVAVRPCAAGWYAHVEDRATSRSWWATHAKPSTAVSRALRLAERDKQPGIDLAMQWTYPHPFYVEAE